MAVKDKLRAIQAWVDRVLGRFEKLTPEQEAEVASYRRATAMVLEAIYKPLQEAVVPPSREDVCKISDQLWNRFNTIMVKIPTTHEQFQELRQLLVDAHKEGSNAVK